jgi:hypothetical protein
VARELVAATRDAAACRLRGLQLQADREAMHTRRAGARGAMLAAMYDENQRLGRRLLLVGAGLRRGELR